jgi:cell division protein ZapA
MGQVNVSINGKTYRMACEDGEEDHLAHLAARLNASIEQLRARFGEIGDQRLTVMAAITLADQSAEADKRVAAIREDVVSLEQANADLAGEREANEGQVVEVLDELAGRLEAIAERLAGSGPDG